MASYLSNAQKNFINEVIDDVFDTFSREIVVYSNPQETVISTSASYNYFYDKDIPQVETKEFTTVKNTFQAKIKYLDQSKAPLPGGDTQQKIEYPAGSVKIKVPLAAYAIIKEARRVEFDGRRYAITSDSKPYGMFGPRYYSFILSPINE